MKKLNKRFITKNQLNAQQSSGSKRASCYCRPTCASQCGIGTNLFAQQKLDVDWIVNKDYNANN